VPAAAIAKRHALSHATVLAVLQSEFARRKNAVALPTPDNVGQAVAH
jgi:hypothetical protein